MSCAEMATLLHGKLDDELDLASAMRLEKHLETCGACAAEFERQKQLRAAIRQPGVYYEAPESLRRTLESAIPSGVKQANATPWWQRFFADWRVGAASSLALAASLALFIATGGMDDTIQQDLVAGHIRSLQENHLTDVATSDRHTVKPWFNGKVDASPPVLDLADKGFPLAGGRLDYVEGRTAAVLVYRRRQHVINLFVWPDPREGEMSPRASSHQGYHLQHWTREGLSFWAVSELDMDELRDFATIYAAEALSQ